LIEQYAMQELEILRDIAPEEVNVALLLVRVYRLLKEDQKAAQMLAVARDMSPTSVNKLKRLLDGEELEGPEGDSMEEG
jgi:anaphase-promoting complex subunit 3